MNCVHCGLPKFYGVNNYSGPQCQCQWSPPNIHTYDEEIKSLRQRITVLENDAKYEGEENERRTLRFRAEIEDMCKQRAELRDLLDQHRQQYADKCLDLIATNQLINDIFAALRDEPYTGYGREKVMQMIRDWYTESDGE